MIFKRILGVVLTPRTAFFFFHVTTGARAAVDKTTRAHMPVVDTTTRAPFISIRATIQIVGMIL